MIYGIGIALALLIGGVIGLLLMAAHYRRTVARQQRYEQEAAQDAALGAVVWAIQQQYRPAVPRNSKATVPWPRPAGDDAVPKRQGDGKAAPVFDPPGGGT